MKLGSLFISVPLFFVGCKLKPSHFSAYKIINFFTWISIL